MITWTSSWISGAWIFFFPPAYLFGNLIQLRDPQRRSTREGCFDLSGVASTSTLYKFTFQQNFWATVFAVSSCYRLFTLIHQWHRKHEFLAGEKSGESCLVQGALGWLFHCLFKGKTLHLTSRTFLKGPLKSEEDPVLLLLVLMARARPRAAVSPFLSLYPWLDDNSNDCKGLVFTPLITLCH